MELNQLHYFVAVAKTENITKAAQELFITQPALSRVILRLERELGTPLFDRNGGKLTLNTQGKVFLTYVQPALDEINTGVHAVIDELESKKILIHNYLVTDLFKNVIDRCAAEFPNFIFDVQNIGNDHIEDEQLSDASPDIVMLPTKNFRSYIFPMSYMERWCVIYNKKYHFHSSFDGKHLTMAQLGLEPVSFLGSHYDRQFVEGIFSANGMTPHLIRAASLSDSSNQISRCKSVGFVPVSNFRSLYERLDDSPLAAAMITDVDCSRMLYLGRSPRFLANADEYRVLEAIKNSLSDHYAATDAFYESYFEC